MNRRDLFRRVLGAIAAAVGVPRVTTLGSATGPTSMFVPMERSGKAIQALQDRELGIAIRFIREFDIVSMRPRNYFDVITVEDGSVREHIVIEKELI